jgi:hypothetical protein
MVVTEGPKLVPGPAAQAKNPKHVPPAGHRVPLAFIQFRLPDGEHTATYRGSHDPEEARVHIHRMLMQNHGNQVEYDHDKDFQYVRSHNDILALQAEWKSRQGDRVTADEMGLDTPARIITNPEVVSGSRAEFDKMKADGLLPEDAVYEAPAYQPRTELTSVKPIGLVPVAAPAAPGIAPPGTIVR